MTRFETMMFGIRRLVARGLDQFLILLSIVFIAWLLGQTESASIFANSNKALLLTAILYIPIEATLTYIFGRGPGKLLLGLQVVSKSGELSSVDAIKRASIASLAGQGLLIDPAAQILLFLSAVIYVFWETTIWDEIARTRVTRATK